MIYRFAEFELDSDQSRVTHGGKEIPLQPKVFEALLLLVRNPGQLVTKQEMMEALWPETFVNEEALAQIIFKLRRALGDTRDEPRFVQTVLKRGFRFLPEVTKGPDDEGRNVLEDDGRKSASSRGPSESVSVTRTDMPEEHGGFVGLVEEGVNQTRPQPADTDAGPAIANEYAPQASLPSRTNRRWRLKLLFGLMALGLIAGTIVVVRQTSRPHQQGTSPVPPSKVRRLTFFPERDEDADVSPDGKSFTFASKHGGDGFFRLYVMSTTGGSPLRLTRSQVEEQTPRFSSDGQWIAYTRSNEGGSGHSVWRVAAMGGQESQLAADASLPDWSPDGREILFVRKLADGQCALIRMPLDDKSERQILRWTGLVDMPAWSPDGTQIAFVNKEAAWVVPSEGGQPRRITESNVSVQTLAWTPDSKAIICDATWGGRRNLWLRAIDDGAPGPITYGSGVDTYPSITPDWKYVLYTTENWQRLIWKVDRAGRHPVNTQSKTTFESISTDPAGRSLAYSDYEPGDLPGNEIGVLDMKTLEQRKLGSGYFPIFSPDAMSLAFLRDNNEGNELYDMQMATGKSRPVSQTVGLKVEPAWSTDGTRIAFQRAVPNPGLTIVEVAGGRETLLALGNYESPAWSPDGHWIAAAGFGSEGNGLYLFDLTSLQAKRISETRSYEAAPVWASDSRSLQILVDERTRPALLTLSLDGTPSSRLELEFIPDPSFWGIFLVKPTPDGYLYLLQRVEGDIYMAELPPHVQ